MIPPASAPAFLAAHGWPGAAILPLAGDASFRRYFRVVDGAGAGERRAVLMDAPPDKEDSRPFLAIGAHLDALGFSTPRPLATDFAQGLFLIEDFGDARVNPVLAQSLARETEIYTAAIDVLVELHRHPAPAIAAYGASELRREVRLFPEWYLAAAGVAQAPGYDAAWDAVLAQILFETQARPVLTLRDYHADNLMLLDRPGVRGLGLLDYQDALAGHAAYDLVSLLQDARRDVAPALEAAMLDRYIAAARIADPAAFRAAYEILGCQRNTKILGVFTRLWKRDNKPAYPRFNPRVWGYLDRNLAHPALAPVADWFAAHVPAAARRQFEALP
jgi:aminoglycoside/choline kinase family phosphotransferase